MNDDRLAEIKTCAGGRVAWNKHVPWLIAEVERLRTRLAEPHRDVRSGMTQLQYGQWLMEQIVEHDDANGDLANHIGDELRDALRAACDEIRALRSRCEAAEAEVAARDAENVSYDEAVGESLGRMAAHCVNLEAENQRLRVRAGIADRAMEALRDLGDTCSPHNPADREEFDLYRSAMARSRALLAEWAASGADKGASDA